MQYARKKERFYLAAHAAEGSCLSVREGPISLASFYRNGVLDGVDKPHSSYEKKEVRGG